MFVGVFIGSSLSRSKVTKDANIDKHGGGWRIRYVVDRVRHSLVVKGTKADARAAWHELQAKIAKDAHTVPSQVTLAQWIPQFTALVEAKRDNARTAEYYAHKLRYAERAFGDRPLRKITASDIDKLTGDLKGTVSEGTRKHVYVSLKACLSVAVRKGLIERNPAMMAEGVHVDQVEVGETLPREHFRTFLDGFEHHPLEKIVTVALHTGARLNEILALRHSDVDYRSGVLKIAQAVERTKAHGTRFKKPKSGKPRELAIDPRLLELLQSERERLARRIANVPDDVTVDTSLVIIPPEALIFWGVPQGRPQDYAKPRCSWDVSRNFRKQAAMLGYPKLRFHDLRGSHETALLDAGVPVHVVAARCGHSAAMLLKAYAERTNSADARAAAAMKAIVSV